MTNQEQYKIALNILARVGLDGNLQEEFSKAVSTLNGFQSYMEINPPLPQTQPSNVLPTNPNTGGINSPQMTQPITPTQMP